MDVRLLGKKNEGEGLGVAVLVDSAFAELKDKSDEQLAEAQRFLIDFMKKVARLKGVRIDRPHFLRSELRRKGVHKDVGEFAVETTPVTAGMNCLPFLGHKKWEAFLWLETLCTTSG